RALRNEDACRFGVPKKCDDRVSVITCATQVIIISINRRLFDGAWRAFCRLMHMTMVSACFSGVCAFNEARKGLRSARELDRLPLHSVRGAAGQLQRAHVGGPPRPDDAGLAQPGGDRPVSAADGNATRLIDIVRCLRGDAGNRTFGWPLD